MEKTTKLVIKSGYVNIPISKGLIPILFSKPPNVLIKSAGKTAGIKVKNRIMRVDKKTAQVTNDVFNVTPDSILLVKFFNIVFIVPFKK